MRVMLVKHNPPFKSDLKKKCYSVGLTTITGISGSFF